MFKLIPIILTIFSSIYGVGCSAETVESDVDQIQQFGENHMCRSNETITDRKEIWIWYGYLMGLESGQFQPKYDNSCVNKKYAPLFEDEGAEMLNNQAFKEGRQVFVSSIHKMYAQDDITATAAEYSAYVYYGCRYEKACFEAALEEDDFINTICGGKYRYSDGMFEEEILMTKEDPFWIYMNYLSKCTLLQTDDREEVLQILYDQIDSQLNLTTEQRDG